jgi:mono/diheme cytochrome c family protein
MPNVRLPGLVIIAGGLLLGAGLATGMHAQENSSRAQAAAQIRKAQAIPPPVTVQAQSGDAARGQAPYGQFCSQCHGATGNGNPPLHGPLLTTYYHDDSQLAGLVRGGIGRMPARSPDVLPDQQLADIIALIRSFP